MENISCEIYKNNLFNNYSLLKIEKNELNKCKTLNILCIDDYYGGEKFLLDIYKNLEDFLPDYVKYNGYNYFYICRTNDPDFNIKKVYINKFSEIIITDVKSWTNNESFNHDKLFNNLKNFILEKETEKMELIFFMYKHVPKKESIIKKLDELSKIKNLLINGINLMTRSYNDKENFYIDSILNNKNNVWINLYYDNYNHLITIIKDKLLFSNQIKKTILKIDYSNNNNEVFNRIVFEDFYLTKYLLINNKFKNKLIFLNYNNSTKEFLFKYSSKEMYYLDIIIGNLINSFIKNVKYNDIKFNIEYFQLFKKIIAEYSYIYNKENRFNSYLRFKIYKLNEVLIEYAYKIILILSKKMNEEKRISDELFNLVNKCKNYPVNNKGLLIIERIIKNLLNYNIKKNQYIEISMNNQLLKKSSDFITSYISLSSWIDELNNNGSMGLVFKIKSTDLCKLGIGLDIVVENLTTTFFPYNDYLITLDNYLSKKDITGNINGKNIIFGNAIGNGNCIIPIYINKKHWIVGKEHLNNMLGIIAAHNPFAYSKNHLNCLFKFLIDFSVNLIFFENKDEINQKTSYKWLNCYFLYFRTCSEVCFEKKYNRGIIKLVDNFIKNPKKRIMYDQFYYINLLSQMLCTGHVLEDDKLNMLIEIIFEELIRINIMNIIYPLKKPDEEKNYLEEFNKKFTFINFHVKVLITFIKLNKIMGMMINKIGSFNKFIKMLDSNYGLMDEDIINWLKNIIKQNMINEEEKKSIIKDSEENIDELKSIDYVYILYKLRKMNLSKNLIKKYINYGYKYRKNKKIIKLIKKNSK